MKRGHRRPQSDPDDRAEPPLPFPFGLANLDLATELGREDRLSGGFGLEAPVTDGLEKGLGLQVVATNGSGAIGDDENGSYASEPCCCPDRARRSLTA